MTAPADHRDLLVWQKAMDLVTECYRLSNRFPRSEDFGLRLQLRTAAVSIPANIAEGRGRTGIGEYLHHLSIAHGSLKELETHLEISRRLDYLAPEVLNEVRERVAEVGRLLGGLIRKLRSAEGKR
jgi:four helix bundle protein